MTQHSAGILLYRYQDDTLEVLLVHPGGPLWKHKDLGAWSIPKGLFEVTEDALDAAKREFVEETGFEIDGAFLELGEIKQPSNKIVHAWAIEGNLDATRISSNSFTMEWPMRSGHIREFPEVDRGEWFDLQTARKKIYEGQAPFLDRLIARVKG
jgi:predicted NUDIX family NTP pyrophosphohydrolase